MSNVAVKFFHLASKKFKQFPFETLEELINHLGPEPIFYGYKPLVVCKDYSKLQDKNSYMWGTRADEIRARKKRTKQYIWKE